MRQDRSRKGSSSRLGTQMKMDLVIVDPTVSEFNKCFIASFNDTCAADFQYQHCLSAGEKRDMGLRGGVLSPR
ncbi:hypothetical protein DPMN_166488 [Dreissena polymorpha]|uniref:Uncharacterized protein n=1 Tax=Dreissena polymorpha TaxID=45954 RepID=A0A9D4F1K5_DREPO|nr:hypothetical protein DPMN_166488 [Dreissena polymorpha]